MPRPRLAVFGNSQADQRQKIISEYLPLTCQYEVVPVVPVYLMSAQDRETFANQIVPTLDVLMFQSTSDHYYPATRENILSKLKPGALGKR